MVVGVGGYPFSCSADGTGSQECRVCPAGSFGKDRIDRRACLPGEISGRNASACTRCEPGTYPKTEVVGFETHGNCTVCPAGVYCADGVGQPRVCIAGRVPNASRGAAECVLVGAGLYSDDGRGAKRCASGYYPNKEARAGVPAAGSDASCFRGVTISALALLAHPPLSGLGPRPSSL